MDTFINQLAEGINAADSVIEPGTALVNLPNWDSLAILTTLSMVDMEYGVTITGTELQNCRTVGDLYTLVQGRKT